MGHELQDQFKKLKHFNVVNYESYSDDFVSNIAENQPSPYMATLQTRNAEPSIVSPPNGLASNIAHARPSSLHSDLEAIDQEPQSVVNLETSTNDVGHAHPLPYYDEVQMADRDPRIVPNSDASANNVKYADSLSHLDKLAMDHRKPKIVLNSDISAVKIDHAHPPSCPDALKTADQKLESASDSDTEDDQVLNIDANFETLPPNFRITARKIHLHSVLPQIDGFSDEPAPTESEHATAIGNDNRPRSLPENSARSDSFGDSTRGETMADIPAQEVDLDGRMKTIIDQILIEARGKEHAIGDASATSDQTASERGHSPVAGREPFSTARENSEEAHQDMGELGEKNDSMTTSLFGPFVDGVKMREPEASPKAMLPPPLPSSLGETMTLAWDRQDGKPRQPELTPAPNKFEDSDDETAGVLIASNKPFKGKQCSGKKDKTLSSSVGTKKRRSNSYADEDETTGDEESVVVQTSETATTPAVHLNKKRRSTSYEEDNVEITEGEGEGSIIVQTRESTTASAAPPKKKRRASSVSQERSTPSVKANAARTSTGTSKSSRRQSAATPTSSSGLRRSARSPARSDYAGPPPKIIFCSITTINTRAQPMKFLRNHGGSEVDDISDCTMLCVARGELKKTAKLIIAIISGKGIVVDSWLRDSMKKGQFLNVEGYMPTDGKHEKDWGISLADAIQRGKNGTKPLDGLKVFFSPTLKVKGIVSELKEIALAAGAEWGSNAPKKSAEDPLVVLADDKDKNIQKYLNKGYRVYDKELLTLGILRRKLDLPESGEFGVCHAEE